MSGTQEDGLSATGGEQTNRACADHRQWLGNFLGGIFSYANAFVDSIHVQTSKGKRLILGIWRADRMLPTLKWGRTENQP